MIRFLFDIDPLLPTSIDDVVDQLNKWRLRIQEVGRMLERITFLNGALIKDISLSSTAAVKVNHKLGRKPRGWWVTRPRTSVVGVLNDLTVYETASDDRTITLAATNNATVDVWFF